MKEAADHGVGPDIGEMLQSRKATEQQHQVANRHAGVPQLTGAFGRPVKLLEALFESQQVNIGSVPECQLWGSAAHYSSRKL